MLLFIILLLLVVAVGGGGWGYSRYGYIGWSPAGVLIVLLVVFWATGHLRM